MEAWLVGAVVASALLSLFLLGRYLSLRAALREMTAELDEKLTEDTNTRISVSTGDRMVRAFAARINGQLASLREERRRLQYGDAELKTAVMNIAHDLRTPLTAIRGYLDLAEREPLSRRAGEYLAVIRERTDAMCTLTEEMLRYSVSVGTVGDLAPVSLNVGDILEQSLAGFYGVFTARGMTPEIRMPEAPVVRALDATALRRVFDNILGNAAKYAAGDLTVALTPDGTATFENSAPDLDAVSTERLFDRYFTVCGARLSTGLGLSIARLLTEKMGGSISARWQSGRLRVSVSFPGGAK